MNEHFEHDQEHKDAFGLTAAERANKAAILAEEDEKKALINLGLLDEYGNPVQNAAQSADFDFNKLFLLRPAAAIRVLIFETEEDAEKAAGSLPNNVIVMIKHPSASLEQYAQALATLTMPVASPVDTSKLEPATQAAAVRALSQVPSRATVAKPLTASTRPVPVVAKPLLEQDAFHLYAKTNVRPALLSANFNNFDQLEQAMMILTASIEMRLAVSRKFSTHPLAEDFFKHFDNHSMQFSNEFAQIQNLVDRLRR